MKKLFGVIAFWLCLLPAFALGDTHALLVACSDFVTQPDLGNAISGNLHMIGSALISANVRLSGLSIEDGTIGSVHALDAAIDDAFKDSAEGDLSILYLCTHGILSSSDDEQVYFLLGDGEAESPLSGAQLYELVREIPGEKLLILDACYSGALIGRGMPAPVTLPGAKPKPTVAAPSPFLNDPRIHVLTSASGSESSWYYDSAHLETGAVSYFASALASALGLYGAPEADLNGDGNVTLAELHRHMSIAVPSSSAQLLSTRADSLALPVASGASLSRPLTGFSYGTSLLSTDDPTFDFSFTVMKEGARVQYRLIDYDRGAWNWEDAQTFLDEGDTPEGTLRIGRKQRSLALSDIAPDESGYLMLQIFSVEGSVVQLCSERLIAVQSADADAAFTLRARETLEFPGVQELPLSVHCAQPLELTVSVFDVDGKLVRRLAAAQVTRPSPSSATHLYWDGRDAKGNPVKDGLYTLAAEARVGRDRKKSAVHVRVGDES